MSASGHRRGDARALDEVLARGTVLELLRDPDPPVERAALLIARDAHPALDIDAELGRLDALAEPLPPRLTPVDAPAAQARRLAEYVYGELGFDGDTESYDDPRNSYLDDVLDRRRGIPITLAVLLCAIGRRAGLRVEGIGFPGHFLARVGGPGGVYVDPFHRGRVLDEAALARLARSFLGSVGALEAGHLAPVSTKAIAVRMLMNLKRAHEKRADHGAALVVCDRLADLTGGVEFVRDRGLHALALGARAQAAEDLARYLGERPQARDAAEVRRVLGSLRAGRAGGHGTERVS
jgi:regulator of sirC expression with transglutaminase-like and TPR domain